MAKTDWNLNDTVLPDDMNEIGREINANKQLAEHHGERHAKGGPDEISPEMIGAETPNGAQEKVNTHADETAADDVHGLLSRGRVIEQSGSNENGEYVRFADGTQICWRSATVDLTSDSPQTYALPVNFLPGSWVSASWSFQPGPEISGDNSALRNAYIIGTTNQWEFRCDGSGNSNSTNRLRLFAIGKWK